jgi:deoxyribonuclease (pyrimidine dimer)
VRINCIPPEYLTDQHLRAEWVEMLMLPAFMKRSLKSDNGLVLDDSIEYKLNTGHARFFYNKLKYVEERYKQIESEMISRGFEANPSLDLSMFPKELFNGWRPTKNDMVININRILTRIKEKPLWYTFVQLEDRHNKRVFDTWVNLYEEWFDFKYELKDSDLKRST